VFCLNAKADKEIWRYKTGRRKNSQATPSIDGEYLYAVSYDGLVVCLTVKNGELVWSPKTKVWLRNLPRR
jgi:outer membrane protein assembly factor BamB